MIGPGRGDCCLIRRLGGRSSCRAAPAQPERFIRLSVHSGKPGGPSAVALPSGRVVVVASICFSSSWFWNPGPVFLQAVHIRAAAFFHAAVIFFGRSLTLCIYSPFFLFPGNNVHPWLESNRIISRKCSSYEIIAFVLVHLCAETGAW